MAEVCQQVGSKNFNLAARLFKELLHGIGTVPALSWIRPGAHHHSSDTADYQGAGAHGTWLEDGKRVQPVMSESLGAAPATQPQVLL